MSDWVSWEWGQNIASHASVFVWVVSGVIGFEIKVMRGRVFALV